MQVRVTWEGGHITPEIRNVIIRGVADGAEFILQESNKIVPHDEGTLERSGNFDVGLESEKPAATIYYDTPYAARLHEHPEYNFQGGREGKYLEKVFNRERATVQEYIANQLSAYLGGGP